MRRWANMINKSKNWWWVIFLGIGVLLLALALRVYNLTLLPIFADEAIYVRWAQVMRAEPTLRFLPLSDGKQPLFMWTVMPALKFFTDPLFAGRMVSVFSGAATLVGVFVLTFILFKSKKAAIVAAFLYAVSPFTVFFDRMALVDSMLTAFGVWALVFAVATAKTFRFDLAMLTGFALGGALLTKSPGLFFAALLPTTALVSDWKGKRTKKALTGLKLVGLWLVMLGIGYAMYNILRLGPNFHLIGARNQDYVFPLSHLWTNPRDPFIFFVDRSFEWILTLGPSLVLVLALFGFAVNFKKFSRELVLVSTWFLLPILVQSEFAKVFTARYILFSLPFLFVLAATVFLQKSKVLLRVSLAILAVLVFQAASFNYLLVTDPERANLPRSERSGYLEEWTAGTGIRQVADLLKELARQNPDQEFVVGTEGYFGTLPDGLQIYLEGVPNVLVIGTGLDFSQVPQSLVDSKKAGNNTYLVANSSRLKKDPQELGYKIVAAYQKAQRPEGIREYVQHGPRDTFYLLEVTGETLEPKPES